jgi:hypothetical protein
LEYAFEKRYGMTDPFQRYLRLLGIAAHPSGLDGLRTLVGRHLSAVPFENVSKLLLLERLTGKPFFGASGSKVGH